MIQLLNILKGCFTKTTYSYFLPRKFNLSVMNYKANSEYEEAVYALNGLQSNSAVLQKARQERSSKAYQNLTFTEKHLKTLGIQLQDLDSLNIIHVAGTKGKGSTCAFTESILRKHGYRTGFYSSPHLISVNERIRINGLPLAKHAFTEYFWEVYRAIKNSLQVDEAMPPYFLFLTVMAFYVFVKEQVEAAVIEVGIGGLYDCTNIIRKPVAVGITSLGIDHVSILGNTVMEIAEQKAGIFKPGVQAFTVLQPENAMRVLRKKAQDIGCSLVLSPPLEAYEKTFSLGVAGIVQNVNASLALQLSKFWLDNQGNTWCYAEKNLNCPAENGCNVEEFSDLIPVPMSAPFALNSKFQDALQYCSWPGRFQTVEKNKLTFYLDGAHTQQSMKYCVRWFEEISVRDRAKYKAPILRVLIFNCTGERNVESLLDPLADVNFDLVIFCPNKVSVMKDASSDQSNFMVDPEAEIQRCIVNREVWCHMMRSIHENELSMTSNSHHLPIYGSEFKSATFDMDDAFQFNSISCALNWISCKPPTSDSTPHSEINTSKQMLTSANHIQILVTGSLHLVGGVLSLIHTHDY